jgi:3-oxoacyl-(acyl-carrier-protein) synthase
VVITGMGVIAPNAHGLSEFETALREGKSGIRFIEGLQERKFSCQVGGVPQDVDSLTGKYFSKEALMAMNLNMIYAGIAGIDCWHDAGFKLSEPGDETVDWDTGAIIGTGIGGVDTIGEKLVPGTDAGKVRRLGSTLVEQVMGSSVSARVTGFMGLGGQVTSNSSACTTGTEAIVDAFHKVKAGQSKRMLAGGSEGSSHYIWAGFDAMRVLNRNHNETPKQASRPMSASAGGFVPGSGAGILMVESLGSAQARGAKIYAEILGGHVNCGGQRNGGTMTAPNPEGVQRCIKHTLDMANIAPTDIDAISGHLTATMADPIEIDNWQKALGVSPDNFPMVNATKSLIGHALGAAGGIECVAAILQLQKGFMHGSLNCEDLHPDLEQYINSIPQQTVERDINIIAKASFGFGDVNGCVIFKKWDE